MQSPTCCLRFLASALSCLRFKLDRNPNYPLVVVKMENIIAGDKSRRDRTHKGTEFYL